MDFLELAKARYSCRKFSDEPVDAAALDAIVEAARCAPTATNAQAYKLWVITGEEAVAKVYETTKNAYGAKAFIVLGAAPAKAWTREDDGHNFADVDAGIVGAHILFEIASLGLGTTWVGRVDPAKMQELFPQMQGYDIVGLFPIGHPSPEAAGQPSKKHTTRRAIDEVAEKL